MAHLPVGTAQEQRKIPVDIRHGGGEIDDSQPDHYRVALAAKNRACELGGRLGRG